MDPQEHEKLNTQEYEIKFFKNAENKINRDDNNAYFKNIGSQFQDVSYKNQDINNLELISGISQISKDPSRLLPV